MASSPPADRTSPAAEEACKKTRLAWNAKDFGIKMRRRYACIPGIDRVRTYVKAHFGGELCVRTAELLLCSLCRHCSILEAELLTLDEAVDLLEREAASVQSRGGLPILAAKASPFDFPEIPREVNSPDNPRIALKARQLACGIEDARPVRIRELIGMLATFAAAYEEGLQEAEAAEEACKKKPGARAEGPSRPTRSLNNRLLDSNAISESASAQQIADLYGVTRQAVCKTTWWKARQRQAKEARALRAKIDRRRD